MAASSAFPCWLSEVVLWGCNWLDELVPQHSQPFFVLADSLWDLGSLRERLVERSTSDGVCSTASDVFYIKHQMTFPSFLVAPLNWRLKSQNTQLQSSIPADLPSSKTHPAQKGIMYCRKLCVGGSWAYKSLLHLFKQLLHGWFWIYKYLGSFEIPRL